MSPVVSKYYVHSSLLAFVRSIEHADKQNNEINPSDEPIFISTYLPHESLNYVDIISGIRRREYPNPVVLLSFEKQAKIFLKMATASHVIFLRLPLHPDELIKRLQNIQPINLQEMLPVFRTAQSEYVNKTIALLKHGRELELLNSSLNPLRAACLNALQGIGDGRHLQQLVQLIREDYLDKPEMQELLFCLEKIKSEDVSYLKLYDIFSGLEFLLASLSSQKEIRESTVADIERLMQDFRTLKT